MSHQQLVRDQSICKRKERRYKTSEEGLLRCETAVERADGMRKGTVVDLSKTGLRMLCEGRFEVGQGISTELTTDRSHGIYCGIIRRVEPWVNGQSILGCSLNDPIPEPVLQDLANEGVVNRRSDGRISVSHRATVNWPLNAEEIEVELQDYSSGGLKLASANPIPDDQRLRIRLYEGGQEELVVEARSIWKRPMDRGWVTGVAFTDRDAPVQVAEGLGLGEEPEETKQPSCCNKVLRRVAFAACAAAIVGYAVFVYV